jgi:hypothetical protein
MRACNRNLSGRSLACTARARRKCDEWSSVTIQPRVGPRCLPKFHSIPVIPHGSGDLLAKIPLE